jgi:outer membrane protein assembly factor BamB
VKKAFVPICGLAAALAFGHPWSCFQGDPQHSGRSVNVVGAPLDLAATFACDSQISGSPVVRWDGNVLVGAKDAKLYCLEPDLDSAVWIADLTSYGSTIYFSAPALDDSDNVYITTDRRLVKVDRDGAVLWSWPSNNSLTIRHSSAIGKDGKVYFACYSDSLYALNPDSTLAWARDLGASVNAAPALGSDGRIYVATTRDTLSRKLWCFSPDGSSPWSYDLAAEAEYASPAIGPDSTIYIGAGRYFYAVWPNGTLRWRDSLAAMVQSCPAVANESTLYVLAGARLYCIGTDSVVRWRRTIGGSNCCSPAVDAEGNVYVGTASSSSSVFYCIAPDSTVRDSYVIGDDIWSSPAIGESGRVYVGCMNDSLYLFKGSGAGVAERRRSPEPVRILLLPNPTRGVVRIVPYGRYSVKIFDACGAIVAAASDADRVDLRGLRRGVYMVQVAGYGCPPLKVILR